MHTVYRIETADGKGVCRAMGSPLCRLYALTGSREVERCSFDDPTYKEYRLCQDKHMRFAFPSLDALRSWFPSAQGRALMERHGAMLVPYTVEKLELASPYQCIFDRSTATRGEPLDLATLTVEHV